IIQRCNTAIQKISEMTVEEYPVRDIRLGEMFFIRTFVHFRLKQFFKYIPYIDENVEGGTAEFEAVANRDLDQLNDQYLWERILEDFKKAEALLHETQRDLGRVDKNAATAMVARTVMFMAYEHDDAHAVVNINRSR